MPLLFLFPPSLFLLPSRNTAATHPYAGLFVVSLGASLATMDVAVNVAFPAITAAFALDTRAIRWIVVYYVVTYACLMLACGRLGDAIGHRRVFQAGLVVALCGYLGCALAPDYTWLLLARIVQGISTALLLSCAPALVTQFFAETRRTHALSVHAAITALAATVAPVLGGACIAWLGWSGVFWMRVPIVIAAIALLRWMPSAVPATRATDRYDSALLALAIACLLLAPSVLGTDGSKVASIVLLVAGIAALAAFALRQRRAPAPFFPHRLARDTDFILHNIASSVLQFAAFAVPLVVPYYLARIAGYGPEGIGTALVLFPVGTLLGSSFAPRCARSLGSRAGALIAVSCLGLGTFGISFWSSAPTLPAILTALLINGFGLGLFQVVYTDVIVASLPRSARGVAGSLAMVTRTVGVVLAASALTSALSAFEAQRAAAGLGEREVHAAAFSQLFALLALLPAVIFMVVCARVNMFRDPGKATGGG